MFKAVISPRRRRSLALSPEAALASTADGSPELETLGLKVSTATDTGKMFISGEEERTAELESLGYRVKKLRDTNIVEVGDYRIDTDQQEPEVSHPLDIPASMKDDWTHHIVQLVGPPEPEWIGQIESRGIDVVEPISSYSLFVHGQKSDVERLNDLEFVSWTGPFKPAYRIDPSLEQMKGTIRFVNIGVYPASAAKEVKRDLQEIGAEIVDEWDHSGQYKEGYRVLIVEVWRRRLARIARLPGVRWLEYHESELTPDDERSAQIVAANLDDILPPDTGPVTGYAGALNALSLDGDGVVLGICDTGIDTNDNNGMHPDLGGRLAFFIDRTGGRHPTDTNGHGTHVAGIAIGNGSTRDIDPKGFLLGQGVAPRSKFGSINAVNPGGLGTRSVAELTRQMTSSGADVMNNSWGFGVRGYSSVAALFDRLVRDPDPESDAPLPLAVVFSAGNKGPEQGTIVAPKESKNIIVVGNSHSCRPDELSDARDIRGICINSSRGPAGDNRTLPNVVAPGTDIVSTRAGFGDGSQPHRAVRAPYTDPGDKEHASYTTDTGTSMAAPHVAGLCALLIQWWRRENNNATPSQAMLKALLVNGADDLAGGPDGNGGTLGPIPNNDQGWGRVNLKNMLRAPKVLIDQSEILSANQDEFLLEVEPDDLSRPLRITLVWTDAPGATQQMPALTNDLDLEVFSIDQGDIFKGNVFADGMSVTGGQFDDLNNVECVYIERPAGGYEVAVIAANLRANATRPFDMAPWQDFALVIDNAKRIS